MGETEDKYTAFVPKIIITKISKFFYNGQKGKSKASPDTIPESRKLKLITIASLKIFEN